jgi:hypothetical protein
MNHGLSIEELHGESIEELPSRELMLLGIFVFVKVKLFIWL